MVPDTLPHTHALALVTTTQIVSFPVTGLSGNSPRCACTRARVWRSCWRPHHVVAIPHGSSGDRVSASKPAACEGQRGCTARCYCSLLLGQRPRGHSLCPLNLTPQWSGKYQPATPAWCSFPSAAEICPGSWSPLARAPNPGNCRPRPRLLPLLEPFCTTLLSSQRDPRNSRAQQLPLRLCWPPSGRQAQSDTAGFSQGQSHHQRLDRCGIQLVGPILP